MTCRKAVQGNALTFKAKLDMKFRTKHVLPWLVAAVLSIFSVVALAMPKAAEHEDAPVTMGADVAKPTLSAKMAKPAKGKFVKVAQAPTNAKARSRKK